MMKSSSIGCAEVQKLGSEMMCSASQFMASNLILGFIHVHGVDNAEAVNVAAHLDCQAFRG